ncbi:tRNA (N6-threonylcarbamoyladenosine(37)-N6)-methyltransferase TrmO [Desulfobulbus rhabdoformis]|uniref:tRNA (N6-threonylcarbamoyladenosine(37)-N6)-methyltransferase TrmO n=1 Tax=Desulfobulbus rhabdoformis TaxID=34032 RepID=UPI001965A59F|nr:tRNA (N6-threonylcarbamoyladenosine(37)-N6)-methyltransferase TrmO [Desulfobulbus rhabdoformis]MBM9615075.1 tRNA (N6-threonylcarbamoyladenosine(37)-N6)-methyltransferase TrmO [Desulfobulbus rhabdoformis]
MDITYTPIGYFKTPFTALENVPIQPTEAKSAEGIIEVFPEFAEGLKDLEGFSHVHVLYHLHAMIGYDLMVKPCLDAKLRGIFATRAAKRPNPIGLSVMRLAKVTDTSVVLHGVDVLDHTPVLDIKPYVADFDRCDADRFGWLEGKR